MSIQELSLFWLRVASLLYALGLFRTLWYLLRSRHNEDSQPAPGIWITASFTLATGFHFVSIVERSLALGHLPVDNFFESVSLFALLLAIVYLFVSWRYKFPSLGFLLFPAVALLTWIASTETPIAEWASARVRSMWLIVHVELILLGIVSVVLTAGASIFYLIQERKLKRKDLQSASKLPALGTLDRLINRAMGLGFVFTTMGVIAGSTWAYVESGTRWLGNTNVQFALFTWIFYLCVVFLRANLGWRGRKTAWMSLSLLGCSALTWMLHIGLRARLER